MPDGLTQHIQNELDEIRTLTMKAKNEKLLGE
jgi:hypothetical protein